MGSVYRYNPEEDGKLTKEQIEFKRSVMERIIKARSCGVPAGKIARLMRSNSLHVLLDLIEAKRYPMEAWEDADDALKKLGY